MRPSFAFTVVFLLLIGWLVACVDTFDPNVRATVDVVVVDGTITNLAEPQLIRLNRSKADPLTGRFGSVALTKARVEVVVDSSQVIVCREAAAGSYQLPADFKGQVGHAYQLRFTLSDGSQYRSSQQVMPAVPAVSHVTVRFNKTSLPAGLYPNNYRAGYDAFVATQDPADQHNYYRWDWNLYEKQKWCRTCYRGDYVDSVQQSYIQNGVRVSVRTAVEDCVDRTTGSIPNGDFWNSYTCRTQCWDILHNYTLNLLDDQFINGNVLQGRAVAQVPLFTRQPALLDIRQRSLTASAYRYFQLFQQQVQNNGGVADTPPTVLVGNVSRVGNVREAVVGFFTASAIASVRYWLDKKDATEIPMGSYDDDKNIVQLDDELYFTQNRRIPVPGPPAAPFVTGAPERTITALCVPDNNRTPNKPADWRD